MIKNSSDSARDTGDTGLIPGSGRSPKGGNDNMFQYSSLENLMDGVARWALVHGSQRVGNDRMTEHTEAHVNILVVA